MAMTNPLGRTFNPLPLGHIRPGGWLRDQLRIQADGLSGHLEKIWPEVGPDSAWLGGKGENWELGPYYLDGFLPLAYILDDRRMIDTARKWVDWTLENRGANGWLGPQTGHEDIWWPRAVMCKVLTQYADVTGDPRVEPAIAAYIAHMTSRLPAEPLTAWAKFRWGEYLPTLLWLCGKRPCPVFENTGGLLRSQGYDWTDHFTFFRIEDTIRENPNLATHVVNHAMAVKYPALWSLLSGRETDAKISDTAIAMLDRFHGCATGLFTGDEHLAGRNPSRGTELCAVVEYMYSLGTLTSLLGGTGYADRLESLAYNNLPAAFTADMWSHQYNQEANQVLCTIADRDWTNSNEANIFGLEPHYKCCTANFNQGWPKFVAGLWMEIPGLGLAATAYGPSEVHTTVGDAQVSIIEKTDYPFKGIIEFEVKTSAPKEFPLALRIPSWALGAEVAQNGESPKEVKAGTFHVIQRRWQKKERVTLMLPLKLRVSRGFNDSVSVHRGPLTFALRIQSEWKRIRGEKPAYDYEVYPRSEWNYALHVDMEQPADSISVEERDVKMPCFSEERAPVVLKAKASRVIEWGLDGAWAAPPPQSTVAVSGPAVDVELIPYGSAKLRITEFPLADS